jgi:hypothetical protein
MPSSVVSGTSILATWINISNPGSGDNIQMYAVGGNFLWSQVLTPNRPSGSTSVPVPLGVPTGSYELRFMSQGARIATSNSSRSLSPLPHQLQLAPCLTHPLISALVAV